MRASCLFPNLTVLEWNPPPYPPRIPIIFIHRFLRPTLVSIKASLFESDGSTLLSFLENYTLLCRNLKSVRLFFSDVPVRSTTIIEALSRGICHQKTLENVAMGNAPIDGTALRHLAMLPTLKRLRARLSETLEPQTCSFLPTDTLFRNVEKLVFKTLDIDLVTGLLRPRDQIFHSFNLHCYNRMTSAAVLTFLNVLASRPPTKPLKDLTLRIGKMSRPLQLNQMEIEGPRYHLSYETLQPLTVFGSLRQLLIDWSEQISLDDHEVAHLARSWPMLESIEFYCGRGGYPPFSTKYPTLRGLLSLATSCPDLRTVALSLDATQVPEIGDAEPCKTSLNNIVMLESPIDKVLPVAQFLFKYLPGVTTLSRTFSRPPGTSGAQVLRYELIWKQVEAYLMEFHGILVEPENVDDD